MWRSSLSLSGFNLKKPMSSLVDQSSHKLPNPRRVTHAIPIAILSIVASQLVFATSSEFDFLTFVAIEKFRSDKQWCEKKYPAFKNKNEILFRESVFSQITGEDFIQSNATGERRLMLLAALPTLREELQDKYAQESPKFLELMCTSFEFHVPTGDVETTKKQPYPNASTK